MSRIEVIEKNIQNVAEAQIEIGRMKKNAVILVEPCNPCPNASVAGCSVTDASSTDLSMPFLVSENVLCPLQKGVLKKVSQVEIIDCEDEFLNKQVIFQRSPEKVIPVSAGKFGPER